MSRRRIRWQRLATGPRHTSGIFAGIAPDLRVGFIADITPYVLVGVIAGITPDMSVMAGIALDM